MYQDNLEQARALYAESISLLSEVKSKNFLTYPVRRMGYAALRQGDHVQANAMFKESLVLNQELGHQVGVTACVAGLAAAIGARGDKIKAVELFGAVDSSLHVMDSPMFNTDQVEYQRDLSSVRSALDEMTFNAAWAKGHAMTLEQAVDYAMEITKS